MILRSRPFLVAMLLLCAGAGYLCLSLGKEFLRVRGLHEDYERGIELFKSSQYEEAAPLIDRAIERDPERADLRRIAAYMAYRQDRLGDLRRHFEELVKLVQGPEAAATHFRLGLLDLNGTRESKADPAGEAAHFAEAIKEDERLLDARAALGIALSLKGEAAKARAQLERAWADAQTRGFGQLTAVARLWEIGDMVARGDALEAWLAYAQLYPPGSVAPKGDYVTPIAFALAFRASRDMSSVIRRLCLSVVARVPQKLQDQYAVQLNTIAAAAFDRLGEEQDSLNAYKKAYDVDLTKGDATRRNLAFALRASAARAEDPKKAAEAEEKSLQLYRELLTVGGLAAAERRQLAMALATRLWNAGRTDEALDIVATAGDPASLTATRMRAAIALGKKDFKAASDLLKEAQKLDPNQPDVAAILKRLTLPPEVLNFRVNAWGKYDPRPILSAAVLPRALPVPIAKDKIQMKLDGHDVQPLRTDGEVFYRPLGNLEPGEHQVEISATDTLGLSVSKTLTFSIDFDKEPPRIVGLVPAHKSTAAALTPVISCRCTDPSGIDENSISVAFSGRAGKPVHQVTNAIIVDKGRFAMDFPALHIKKGMPVRAGAVSFQFPDPLGEGDCSVRVNVADIRGNRATKTWTFKAEGEPPPEKGPAKPPAKQPVKQPRKK